MTALPEEFRLLREYAATGSQEAFSRLAERYVDVVYAAARRQVGADGELARDVTQAVFIVLAQRAAEVPADRPLSAWLLRTTSYCAANARRAQRTREHHERRAAEMARELHDDRTQRDAAWAELSPLLDEGLNKLRPADRDAVLLKFFEKKTLREVGAALGISEAAATKRVNRAVERLRHFFRRRGVAVGAGALSTLLLTHATQAAPLGLAGAVATASTVAAYATGAAAAGAGAGMGGSAGAAAGAGTGAAAGGTSAASIANGAMLIMATQKTNAAIVGAAAVLLAIGGAAVAVRALTAPRGPRQVAVSPVATATAAPSTFGALPRVDGALPAVRAVLLDGGTTLNFAGGALVEVIGIRERSPAPGAWWLPDGRVRPEPTFTSRSFVTPGPIRDDARALTIALRLRGGGDRNVVATLSPGRSTGTSSGGPTGAREISHLAIVPKDQKTASLTIRVAVPAWQPELAIKPDAPGVIGEARFLRLREDKGQAVADFQFPPGDPEGRDRQVSVTADGKALRYAGASAGPDGVTSFHFRCPKQAVTMIRYRERAYETVTLKNVSLQPGVATEVAEERAASPLPK